MAGFTSPFSFVLINKEMKLNQILNEKLDSFVFIKESIKMLNILLSRNILVLDEFYKDQKTYYVLHTKHTRKDLDDPEHKSFAIIQLNGSKLNAAIKSKNVNVYLNDKNKDVRDELFSDERIIKDAISYIEQISILIEDKDIVPVSHLKEIEGMCKERNIPLYFYNNRRDFINNNRQNKVELTNPDYNYDRQHSANIPENIKAVLFFYNNSELSAVPEKYSRYLNEIMLDQKRPSFTRRTNQTIGGLKNNPLAVKQLTAMFDDAKTKSIETIIVNIANKWKTIINTNNKKKNK